MGTQLAGDTRQADIADVPAVMFVQLIQVVHIHHNERDLRSDCGVRVPLRPVMLQYLECAFAAGKSSELVSFSQVVQFVLQQINQVALYAGLQGQALHNTCSGGYEIQELVPNVENMQVLYGVDTTGSQMPSEYDTADVVDAANEWGSVVSVRVALLVRSNLNAVSQPTAIQAYNLLGTIVNAPLDTRLRQVYTTTIGLRNRLP